MRAFRIDSPLNTSLLPSLAEKATLAALYANRSLALMKVERWQDALHDIQEVRRATCDTEIDAERSRAARTLLPVSSLSHLSLSSFSLSEGNELSHRAEERLFSTPI